MHPLGESNLTGNGKGKRWVTINALALSFALALICALYLGFYLPQGGEPGSTQAQILSWKLGLASLCLVALSLHSLLSRNRAPETSLPRFVPLVALPVGLILALVAAYLTTPQIAEGNGLGWDGKIYAGMTENFAWTGESARFPYNYRPFVPWLVHLSGLPTIEGYRVLGILAFLGCALFSYLIARHFTEDKSLAALVACLAVFLKLGIKLWVHYPVLTDGVGQLMLTVAVWSVLRQRLSVYLLVLCIAPFCRENLLALGAFQFVHTVRIKRSWRTAGQSVLLHILPLGLFLLSRRHPVFAEEQAYDTLDLLRYNLNVFLKSPGTLGRLLLAQANAVGVLVFLALLNPRPFLRFLTRTPEWGIFALAQFSLAVIGGSDFDRFALWQVPMLVAFAALNGRDLITKTGRATMLFLLAVQFLAAEIPLAWHSSGTFGLSIHASHAKGVDLRLLQAGSLALLVLVFLGLAVARTTGSPRRLPATNGGG